MHWVVYLSGEIHTDWREQIRRGVEEQGLPVSLVSPVTNHEASDAAGDRLGVTESPFGGRVDSAGRAGRISMLPSAWAKVN